MAAGEDLAQRRPDERVRLGERVYFVSDIHLSPSRPDVFVAFCRFLDETVRGARALYVLGDLFDYWVGPRQVRLPGFSEIFERTRRLREEGTQVHFIGGNRDFMLDGIFAAAQGLKVLPDVAEAALGERRVIFTHGDLLCTRDRAYHRMRRVIRGRPARALLGVLPLGLALRLGRGFRAASGEEIRRKSAYVLEPDYHLAREWLERGFDALIFGHVHKGEHHRVRLDGRRADMFILGSWEDAPGYVEWAGGDLELRSHGLVRE